MEGEQPYTSRDCHQFETATCGRYWLFRPGDGVNPSTGPLRRLLNGAFA